MKMLKQRLLVIILLVLLLSTTGCLKQGNPAAMNELSQSITLRYWRVFDGKDGFDQIINNYRQLHPNVNIEYRKLRYDEYEQALIEAWAEDRGPDIFTIHNTWVGEYESKILPMPSKVKMPYVTKRNGRTGEVEAAEYRETATKTAADIRNDFVETVYQDVVRVGEIWGLPLSVDSLALFYNRAMFDKAQITKIPSTWLEIKQVVPKLTLQDEAGNILQSAIALGTAGNINRATDILSLLMMQNGTQMTDSSGRKATFDQASSYTSDKNYKPGLEAVRFYTDFAMPSKEVYSWNSSMEEAEQSFISGKLAMFIGYAYQLPLIRTQAGKLNIGVTGVPHINSDGTDAMGEKINFASYWVETVSRKTKYPDYAWDFLQFATGPDQVKNYLNRTSKPTALRVLVDEQLKNIGIAPFAAQVLTARSWYRGRSAKAVESIFNNMISQVIEGKNTVVEAIEYAAKRVNQTY